jgi:xanthine dehydrogenase molybdenum-binding subunit
MTTTADRKSAQTDQYKVIGTRPVRHDGLDKVTGRAHYGADISLPGLLHARYLRSPHAHARIKSIDTSRALSLPGVKAVVTSADFPDPVPGKTMEMSEGASINVKFMSNNCLAAEKALYKGHAVAAVAATSQYIASEALSLIDVEYEVLTPILDVVEAMGKSAPVLHEKDLKGTNIADRPVFELGDLEEGFSAADVVVEREYRTEPVHQGYIEPHSATAAWSADGSVTIWCSSQGHFLVRDQVAHIMDIPESKIKVIPMEIGGGFGGKIFVYIEPVIVALSKKAGRPVKLTMTRSEVFEGTGPTSGTYIKVKMGVTKKGRITAADAYLAYTAGAFPGSPVAAGAICIFAPYDIPNARVKGFDVVVNMPKVAAYRAPGAPMAAFAVESVIDEICETLGMDQLEFRRLNGAKEGSRQVIGVPHKKIGLLETVEAAKRTDHYNTPLEGPNRGRGVAAGYWLNATGPASAVATVNGDGTVNLIEGSPDIGGTRAAAAMQFAEALGITAEDVRPSVGDTESVGYTTVTGGSSVAFKTGLACFEAAQDVKKQMLDRAAKIWEASPDDVTLSDGIFSHNSDPELRMTFKELAGKLIHTGGPVVGSASVHPRGVGGAFAVHIADVEVDPETGKVAILRYTAVQDVGTAIHPSYVEGQLQGGAVQGIGWALNEEYVYNKDGRMLNPTFLDYRMPTSLDLPMIDTVIVEVPNPGHPYGVRGVGEVPIVPPLAAIANAIHYATNIRMRSLPMSPGRILEAIWDSEA